MPSAGGARQAIGPGAPWPGGGVGHAFHRPVDHAEHRHAVFDQADRDAEFVVALEELARAVERVDQPEAAADPVGRGVGFGALLRDDRDVGRQRCQRRQDDVLRRGVGQR
jgi:hypothetical protein